MAAVRSTGRRKVRGRKAGINPQQFLGERYKARDRLDREAHRFQSQLLTEAARCAGTDEVVPAAFVKLLSARAKGRVGVDVFPPAPSSNRFARPPLPGDPAAYLPRPEKAWLPHLPVVEVHVSSPTTVIELVLEDATYSVGVKNGNAHESFVADKSAGGRAGTASLDGDALSSVVFGFETSFTVADPGSLKQSLVQIETSVNAHFSSWDLEALSFSPHAYGEVQAVSTMFVLVGSDSTEAADVVLLHGESPRGQGGDPGIWSPGTQQHSASHELRIVVKEETVVTVFEMIELTARRHGDPSKCNALIGAGCTWDPVFVRIETGVDRQELVKRNRVDRFANMRI